MSSGLANPEHPADASLRTSVSRSETLRWRARALEFAPMPMAFRRLVLRALVPDPFTDRSRVLDSGQETIFIHVPKTGGTSLASAIGLRHGHLPVSRFIARDADRFHAGTSFAFVRNPWDRLFSAFQYLHTSIGRYASRDARWAGVHLARYGDFEAFVMALNDPATCRRIWQWPHFRPQTDWICLPGETAVSVSFLGRYETIAADTDRLATRLGVSLDLPVTRQARGSREKRYTADMIDIVARLYRRDIEILDYDAPDAASDAG